MPHHVRWMFHTELSPLHPQAQCRIHLYPVFFRQYLIKQVDSCTDGEVSPQRPPDLRVTEEGEFLAPEVFREVNAKVSVLRPYHDAARHLQAVVEHPLEEKQVDLPVVATLYEGVVAVQQPDAQDIGFPNQVFRCANTKRIADMVAKRWRRNAQAAAVVQREENLRFPIAQAFGDLEKRLPDIALLAVEIRLHFQQKRASGVRVLEILETHGGEVPAVQSGVEAVPEVVVELQVLRSGER